MTQERIIVTGYGLLTALGLDVQSSWENLLKGVNPVRRFTLFDPSGLSACFGMELPEGTEDLFKKIINPRRRRQMTRSIMIAIAAARAAIENAGLQILDADPKRVGVVFGATGTGYAPMTTELDPNRILRNMASASAAWIGMLEKVKGPSFVVSTACASGVYAIHAAHMLISTGQCDIVICGAADSAVNRLDVEGFQSLLALAEDEDYSKASRPFDKTRNGFVIGEGGGALILEKESLALKRNASLKAICHLPGLTSDAYNIISPSPEGESIAECMKQALSNAGVSSADLGYINAHGTSTLLNDRIESTAVMQVFGDSADRIAISSTKGQTGHCLSGAAAVEAILTIKALEQGILPPTANLQETDPDLNLNYIKVAPIKQNIVHAMSNSFAFGGHNGSVVFSKI